FRAGIHDTWRGSMRGVRIPQNLNGEDQFILGLSVTRLAGLLLGLLAAYTILHLTLPAPLQLGGAAVAALSGAAFAWIRPAGRSLLHWAMAAIEFKFSQQVPLGAKAGSPAARDRELASAGHPSTQGPPRLSVVINSPKASRPQPAEQVGPVAEEDVIQLPESASSTETDLEPCTDKQTGGAPPLSPW